MADQCVKCSLPLNEENKCSCNGELCFHCCECGPDCGCGCAGKKDGGDEGAEEV